VGFTVGFTREKIDQNSVFGFAEPIVIGICNALASIRQLARRFHRMGLLSYEFRVAFEIALPQVLRHPPAVGASFCRRPCALDSGSSSAG
jgi:hypothetical protein